MGEVLFRIDVVEKDGEVLFSHAYPLVHAGGDGEAVEALGDCGAVPLELFFRGMVDAVKRHRLTHGGKDPKESESIDVTFQPEGKAAITLRMRGEEIVYASDYLTIEMQRRLNGL